MSNATPFMIFLRQAAQIGLIVLCVLMIVAGITGLVYGRLSIRRYKLHGPVLRILSALLALFAAAYLILRYALHVDLNGAFNRYSPAVLLLAILVLVGIALLLAEKPSAVKHLPAESHTLQSGPDEPPYRLHLRLMKDGSGLLIVNASTVLHLNATAAEYAFHMMKGTLPEEAARQMSERYHISQDDAREHFIDFRERVQTLIHTPDLDPTTYLDFERVAPHSQFLTAPLRLDCAVTYRLPSNTQADYAPTKRVERELTTQEWQSIMDKAWSAGIPHVTFTGGEPTLREDLPELIAHAEKIGQVTGLLSDGLKLADKAYLHTLLQTGLDHLLFILQPGEPASWKALEAILPEDLYTTVHLTISPETAAAAVETLERLASMGVKSLSLATCDTSLHATLKGLRDKAAGLGMTLRWDLPVPYSAENPVAQETLEDEIPSGAGRAWLYVEPDGDVLPAQGEAEKIMGNLLRDPWEKVYKL